MALSPLKTWGSEILTASDLNAEFLNIYNNPYSLISPVTSDITWNDSVNATFGTGGDADIRYDGTDLLILPAVVGTGDVRISGGSLRTQDSEGVWFGTGDDARVYYDGTNMYLKSNVVGSGHFIFDAARTIFLNETSNANMTVGMTLTQGAITTQVGAFKNGNVATGLTTATLAQDVETDDFLTIGVQSSSGGAAIQAMANDAAATVVLGLFAYGGTADTTDTTGSVGLITLDGGEHDGANAMTGTATNGNLLTVRTIDAGGAGARLLLKADDGELHIGNTTLVTLSDDEDDPQFARAMIHLRYAGDLENDPYYNPSYDYEALKRIGVVGEKDARGNFLIRVQPYLGMHDMCIWQLATNMYRMRDHMNRLDNKLALIEQRVGNG